ncbi:MAG: undecaprenyl/decaprenyl-phosphate alpha-N-acetylglucosaminyl 1-phosphate transferase [Prevotellaceae bacterium]|jgi:UDP-N-acetylmuramyl pentapeptide phosphotransferase/UDP-N-acetylglucosamine-1-phosphate transferase|nr:undecaprenyl/decaprenyl-phosphate alpha-N-acetylglucosaminyl 1-phosphate transferase [Prevotellaceae bacterium]
MYELILGSFFLAGILGFALIPPVRKLAVAKDLVAKPNHRTSHTGRIPNIGGVAIFSAFILAFLFVSAQTDGKAQYIGFIALGMFLIGLYDDVMVISPKLKLGLEALIVLLPVCVGDFRLTHLHGFFGINELNYIWGVLLTTFVIIVIINAVNLIDGIDGLAAGVGMVVSLFFGIYFALNGEMMYLVLSFCLLGALLPFFGYNVFSRNKKIFMGDSGSLVIGALIAVLTIKFNEINIASASPYRIINVPMVSICVLVLPMFDTLRVFVIRAMQGKSPFLADKNHLHHMFLSLGFNHKQSTGIMLTISVAYIFAGLLLQNTSKTFFFLTVIVSCVVWSEIVRLTIKTREKDREKKVKPIFSEIM